MTYPHDNENLYVGRWVAVAYNIDYLVQQVTSVKKGPFFFFSVAVRSNEVKK